MMEHLILDRLSRHQDTDVQDLVRNFRVAVGIIASIREDNVVLNTRVRNAVEEIDRMKSEQGWANDISKWGT